ncbi:DUF1643 domain-containing protein [Senegalia sp. (in: firmicutes)]|uniref:DUF1643 domain-containing protein n=1 Tax=Senegalia sp. (in: firmicutes) TaxID=1924098 RepID=UPI003F9B2D2B
MKGNALISQCKNYRYFLTRDLEEGEKGKVVFILLNPSTADHEKDDNTLKKCIGFSERWGYTSLEVVNLFAFRATKPSELYNKVELDIVGNECNKYIKKAVESADKVIVGWGCNGNKKQGKKRSKEVLQLLSKMDKKIYSLGQVKSGHPRHPLMPSYETPLEEYEISYIG